MAAQRVNRALRCPDRAIQSCDGVSSLRDWFTYRRDVDLREEVVGLGSYGKTMTVLTSETFADEDEEEEELEESWRPRWR